MSTTLSYPQTSMAVLPASMAALYGSRPAVVDGDRVLTYDELDTRSAGVAAALHDSGVRDQDVVLLHLRNSIEFVVAYYGSLRAGATVTLVNPLQPVPGLRHQIVETGAVAAFTQTEQAPLLRAAVDGTDLRTVVVVDDGSLESFVAGHDRAPEVSVGPEDVAHLAFTGGTTGVSKGVRVLHRNVLANVTQMIGGGPGMRWTSTPTACSS